jgi:predicted SAM-dependent methyltransferase
LPIEGTVMQNDCSSQDGLVRVRQLGADSTRLLKRLARVALRTITPAFVRGADPGAAAPATNRAEAGVPIPMTPRQRYLTGLVNLDGMGLEIGPSHSPIVPKAWNCRIETLDYLDANGLREKYKNDPSVDISKIEPVDYVSDGRSMVEVIAKRGHYDYILASHVIEHTPDMLGFLKDCEALLKPDGILVLAVPDKRRCFDVFQSLSSTGQMLEAHAQRRTRPSAGSIFDMSAYTGLRDGNIVWLADSNGSLSLPGSLQRAAAEMAEAQQSGRYFDVHVWRFVPSSFRLILRDFYEIEAIALREMHFEGTAGAEFYCSLSRQGAGCPLDRLTLAKSALQEQCEVVIA